MQSAFPGPDSSVNHRDNIRTPRHEKRSRSSDHRPRPRSMFPSLSRDQEDKRPWYMREPRGDPPSLALQSRTDSGIGDELWRTSRGAATPTSSSFGMILKDKFQKNPNMYKCDQITCPFCLKTPRGIENGPIDKSWVSFEKFRKFSI